MKVFRCSDCGREMNQGERNRLLGFFDGLAVDESFEAVWHCGCRREDQLTLSLVPGSPLDLELND